MSAQWIATAYPSGSANTNVLPNGVSNGAVKIGTPRAESRPPTTPELIAGATAPRIGTVAEQNGISNCTFATPCCHPAIAARAAVDCDELPYDETSYSKATSLEESGVVNGDLDADSCRVVVGHADGTYMTT